jgi:type VI secretion system protein ImpL
LQRAALVVAPPPRSTQLPLEMVLPKDQALVDEVRKQLAASSLAERAYSRLKRLGADGVPDFRVTEAGGPQAALVFTRASGAPLSQGIAGMFTVAGYDKGFRAQAPLLVKQLGDEEGWVLGTSSNGQGVTRMTTTLTEVQQLYLNEYIKTWDDLLGDLRLIPSTSLQGSIQTITLLSAGDSPLKLLLNGVAKETKLATGNDKSAEAVAAGVMDKAAGAMRSTVDKLMGTPAANAGCDGQARSGRRRPLRAAAARRGRAAGPAGAARRDAGRAQGIRGAAARHRRGDQARRASDLRRADRRAHQERGRPHAAADQQPAQRPDLAQRRAVGQRGQAGVKAAAAGEVGGFCKQAVDGRYPFVARRAQGSAARRLRQAVRAPTA